MTWTTPKTDWDTNPTNPTPTDLNRIEGNIDFLKSDIETKKGLIVDAINAMGQPALVTDTHATLATKIKDISDDADALTTDVLPTKTFYQGGVKKTGNMPTKGSETFTPTTTNQTISANQYLTGVQTILGDADLVTGNIKAGANIFGVAGKASVVDTADATIVAGDVLSGKTGYKNGSKITGTIPSKGAATITPGTTNQTIASGQYLSGIQTIAGDADLVASNIKSGVDIFGVVGTLQPRELLDGTTYKVCSYKGSYTIVSNTTKTKKLEMLVYVPGYVKIQMKFLYTDASYKFEIYKNGTTTGIVGIQSSTPQTTASIAVSPGDLLQIYCYTTGGSVTNSMNEFHVLSNSPPLIGVYPFLS